MIRSVCRTRSILVLALVLLADSALAQFYPPTLGNGPWTFSTFEQENLKVSVVTRGMAEAYGMVFLPGTASEEFPTGDILFTERRTGLVRLFRNGELLAAPAGDLKAALPLEQLFDINLHPRFADNGLLYFTWSKRGENPDGSGGLWMTTAVVRGRWDGNRVVDLEEEIGRAHV